MELAERMMAKVTIEESGCWTWRGALTEEGYGSIRVRGRTQRAHRVAYELFAGAIPVGAIIDHLCRVRACCNPDHLEPVSNRTNVGRGINPLAARIRAFDSGICLRGHDLSLPGAVYVRPSGNRECVQCRRDRKRAYMRAYMRGRPRRVSG